MSEKYLKARDAWWACKRPSMNATEMLEAAMKFIGELEQELHLTGCKLAEHQVTHWPRVKNLPAEEQEPFMKWLTGQTCPFLNGAPYHEQDAYYECDYQSWKLHLAKHPLMS